MPRCAATKSNGEQCERLVGALQEYCYAQDPRHQEARSWAASKAARSKPNRELQVLKNQATQLYREVHTGEVEPKAGAVLTQITNTQARILELERRIRETEELAERIERLENAEGEGRRSPWGA